MGPRPRRRARCPRGAAPAIDREGLDGAGTLLRDDELVAARREGDLYRTCGRARERLRRSGERESPWRESVKPLMLPLPPALST